MKSVQNIIVVGIVSIILASGCIYVPGKTGEIKVEKSYTAKEGYQIALEEAKKYDKNNTLSLLRVYGNTPIYLGKNYLNGEAYAWHFIIRNSTGGSFTVIVADDWIRTDDLNDKSFTEFYFQYPIINLNSFIASEKAFEIAWNNGGKEVFDKYPKKNIIYILESPNEGRDFYWTINFEFETAPRKDNVLSFVIDASSGEILKKYFWIESVSGY